MANLSLLNELRTTKYTASDLEELLALDTFAHALRARYEARQVPEPDWLNGRIVELGSEIRVRTNDAVQKRIRELKAQQQSLMTPEQKRAAVAAELAALEATVIK